MFPLTKFIPDDTVFINAYNGKVMNEHPTFLTKTGNTSGNLTFHGGVKLDGVNAVSFHDRSRGF